MILFKRITSILLCMFVIAVLLPVNVMAAGLIETDRDVKLTITYLDNGKAIPGAAFEFYRVADVDAYGTLSITAQFDSYPISFDGIDQTDWEDMAFTLKGYTLRDKLSSEVTEITDENGSIYNSFKPGLYLVIGNRRTLDNNVYSAVPTMVFLPGNNETENIWSYNVTVAVKYTKEYNPADNPDDKLLTRRVLKIWDDNGFESLRPSSITVQLLRDGTVYDTQELTAETQWRYVWDNLDARHEWIAVEKEIDGYYTTVSLEGITYTVTNKYICPLVVEDPPVVKKITGDTPSSAATFTFILTAENDSAPMPEGNTGTTKQITISGAGSSEFGKITFTKPGVYTYTIKEENTGISGYTYDKTVYTVTYTITEEKGELSISRKITETNGKEVDSAVFTNKYSTKKTLPQTGGLWWPVPILITGGLVFCMIGVLQRKISKDEKRCKGF